MIQTIKDYLLPFLRDFIWFRKWYGGHWELWYVDHPIHKEVWHNGNPTCELPGLKYLGVNSTIDRPTPLCGGQVVEIEDW